MCQKPIHWCTAVPHCELNIPSRQRNIPHKATTLIILEIWESDLYAISMFGFHAEKFS